MLSDNEGLATVGIAKYSLKENIWVAEIEWNGFDVDERSKPRT